MGKDNREQMYHEAMGLAWLTVFEYIQERDLLKSYHVDPGGDRGRGIVEQRYLWHCSDYFNQATDESLLERFNHSAECFCFPLVRCFEQYLMRLEYGLNQESDCIAIENQDSEAFAAFIDEVVRKNSKCISE